MQKLTKWATVYYGNYAMYFEVARVEAMRSSGFSYKGMEDEGVMMQSWKVISVI